MTEPGSTERAGAGRRASVSRSRRIDLLVDEAELKARAAARPAAEPAPARGYSKLYAKEVLGADQGCDFAFLQGG